MNLRLLGWYRKCVRYAGAEERKAVTVKVSCRICGVYHGYGSFCLL